MSERGFNTPAKRRSFIFRERAFGIYLFTSIAALLICTVLSIVGYILWYQYWKALPEISGYQMTQVSDMVKEKVTNYLRPAAVMAELSSQIMKEGAFVHNGRSAPLKTKSDETEPSEPESPGSVIIINNMEVKEGLPEARKNETDSSLKNKNIRGILSIIDIEQLEAYGIHLLKSFPQVAMANIGDEQGNFLMPKKMKDGTISTKIIDHSVNPSVVIWKHRNKEGEIIDVERSADVQYDPRSRPWYKGAKELRGSYWTDVYIFFSDKSPGITTSYPLINAEDEVVGVFSMDIALSKLSTFLQKLKIGKAGIAYIVNKKDELIAYPDPSRMVKTKADGKLRPALVKEVETDWVADSYQEYKNTMLSRVQFKTDGKRYLASFSNLGETFGKEWKIAVVVPEEDFIGPFIHMIKVVILISLAVLILSVVIAKYISQNVSRPIKALTEEARRIENFEIEGKLDVQSNIREIQAMNQSIESMKRGLNAFKKYVPSTLVRQLIRTGEEAQLGGKKVELTILFSDIESFTNISETLEPEILMTQLFEYNNELTNIILSQRGTIDKYIGDAIMAFWGAPMWYQDHALLACNAALRCYRALEEMNKKWKAEGKPAFVTRFGINTGETIVGNMGSEERMNYSVLGDSVNLASRIEGVNKNYGTNLIITESTYQQVSDHFEVRLLDIVAVKGKKKGVRVYELLGRKGEELHPSTVQLRDVFAKGFAAYLSQQWDQALKIFALILQKFPSDKVAAEEYIKRCKHFKKHPPPENWDGVWILKTK